MEGIEGNEGTEGLRERKWCAGGEEIEIPSRAEVDDTGEDLDECRLQRISISI